MTSKPKILIVDDRPENLLALELTLGSLDAQLVSACSGDQALAATLDHDFALAILDVQMPGMDGYELADILRGDPKTSGIPIIFLTAASSADEQVFKGYESGAVDYIVKPYNPSIVVSKVGVFLELHRQKAELKRHREQLTAVNAELEAFAFSVSHDLRAPLRAIDGFSHALLEDCPEKLNEQERDFLLRISREARRMDLLIKDLLALSRVTRAEMRFQDVDLGIIAMDVIERLRASEPSRHVEALVADGLGARGDARLLQVALENLVSNAWKFTGRRPDARIEVGVTTRGGDPAFFVRDNGVGFDVSHASKIFSPFQRFHSAKEFPGTGVGLSTVFRIIQRHGGSVWFDSKVGQGTTFFFTLDPGEGSGDA